MSAKISIIIPTYNAENTLERCLQSIVQQDYTNFEVWFIDGGSTDSTLQILKDNAIEWPFLRYISEPDKGIYDAMNKGVKLCKGEWLYFLGSDDTLYDNHVLSLIAATTTTTDAKVIYGNVIIRGQNQWNLDNVVFNGEYDVEKIVNVNICHQAMFYHKSIFELLGDYNLRYITSADHDFNLRCFASTPFYYIDTILANFFVGGHSSNVTDDKFNDDRGAILMKYFKNSIYTRPFINSRLFIQKAALSGKPDLTRGERLYCMMAYLKLKTLSLYVSGSK